MQINGKEIRFSISNKNHAANFEKAIRAMEKDEERIRKMSQETGGCTGCPDPDVPEVFSDSYRGRCAERL